MADLEYTVKVSGVEDVERLEKNLDNLHRTLNAGSGAGKSLEEMRKILVGMRGQASVIADLRDSVKSLNTAAENLGKGFESGFNRLDRTLKQGFQLALDRMNMFGAEMRKDLSSGVKGAFDAGTQAAAAGGKKLVAQVNSDAKAVAAAASKYTELENKVRASVRTAMNMPSGNYQTYSPSSGLGGQIKELDRLKEAQKNAAAAADPLRKALKGLTIDGNDTHSAMRGLASGFNLLWLTWGNLAPLFAGAAISNGFMQTAKQGMEVAHTLQTIATLGENSAQDMKSLTAELINLGNNGPYGPLQIAEAMKILSLAGLNAKEVLATTGTVMNFATSGTTDLKTAADVLVSVTTAFGTGAAGFERSADIITRAAADSKASVESFGEAMKTASVVGEQYKVTQEDLALNIQLLAQVGIEGTSAGTAVRNMYADITGRSGQVSKVLRSLGLDFKNVDGSVVTTVKQMELLYGVLKNYDAKSVGNILQAIYGERGAKAAIAALQAYKKEATNPKFANALVEQYEKIKNAAADSAIAAAQMSQTSKKAFESAAATLKTTMFEAFQGMEGELYMTALAFKSAFGDPETKALLEGMTSAVATLGRIIAENLVPLAKIAIAWGTYRTAVLAASTALSGWLKLKSAIAPMLPAVAGAVGGMATLFGTVSNSAQTTTKSVAATSSAIIGYSANITNGISNVNKTVSDSTGKTLSAFSGTSGGFTRMAGTILKALPVIGNVLAVATIGWELMRGAVDRAGESADNYANTKAKNVIDALKRETDQLERVNAERLKGLSLAEAEARVRGELGKLDTLSSFDADISKANQAIADAMEARDKFYRTADKDSSDYNLKRLKAEAAYTSAVNSYNQLLEKRNGLEKQYNAEVKRREDVARQSAKITADEMKKQQEEMEKLFGNGKKSWSLLDFQGSQKDSFAKAGIMRDNELESIKSHFDSQLKAAKEFYDADKKLLDQRNSANLISEQEYLASSMELAIRHQTNQLAVLDKMQQDYDAASSARIEKLQSKQAAAKGKVAAALVSAIKKEQQAAEISNNAFDVKRAEIAAEAYGRVGEVLNKVQTDLGKVIESNKEFWDNRALEQEAIKAAEAIDDKYKNMNTSIMSMDVAMYEFEKAQHASLAQTNKQNEALQRQLGIQRDLVLLMKSALEARIAAGGSTIEEVAAYKDAIWTLEDGVSKLESQLTESTAKGLEDGAKSGMDAFAKARRKQLEEFSAEISTAITDGLMSGDYKSVGKSIRDILQRELVRKPLQAWIQAAVGSVIGGNSKGLSGGVLSGGGSGSGLDFMNLGGSAGDWLMTKSTELGLNGFQTLSDVTFKLGDTLSSVDAWLKDIPGLEGGIGSVLGYGQALFALSEGKYGSAVGTAVGTYLMPVLGPLGPMLGSTLGSLVDGLFDGGSPYYGGDAVSVGGAAPWTGKLGGGYNSGVGNYFGSYAQGISAALTGILKDEIRVKIGFDENKKRARAYLDISDTAGDLAVSRSGVSVAKGEEGVKETINLVAKEAFSALLADERLATYEKQLVAAAAAAGATYENLISAYTQINAVNTAFAGLATTMTMFVEISDDMKTALLNGLGGIEGLSQATQAYYENFYSEAERLTIAGRNMNQALQSLGLDIDVMDGNLAKEAFRKTVEAAFEAGNGSLAASLLGVSGQFAEIADAAQAASDNLGTATGAINSYGEALANLAEKAGYLGATNRYAAENAATTIQGLFANIGIEKDVTSLTSQILAATTADVEDFFRELWPLMQTDAAREQLIQVADAMLDVAARSRELKLNLATLQERLGDTSAIRDFNLDTVTADLVQFGKTIGQVLDFDTVRSEIAGANKEAVKNYFTEVFKGLDTTEAQQKFIGITNAILDVVDATEAIARDLRSEAETLWNDQVSAAKAAVEAQIALHEREAQAVQVLISNAEQEISRLKSEGEIFKKVAGRAFGEAGVKSGTSYTTGSSNTWEEFAAKFGFLDDSNEALVSAQEKLVADLKNEEARHNAAIKNLQSIISESQKQTGQLMSLNTAIDILQTSTEAGIADIVAALEKSAAPVVVTPPAETPTTSTPAADAVTSSTDVTATEKLLKLFEEQRSNAVATLAGDSSAADKFFAAMHTAGVTMFDDVANHSIAVYDAEMDRLKALIKPEDVVKVAPAAAPATFTEKLLKLLEDQRSNAIAALAGDSAAADMFHAAMKAAGVTMFENGQNHSIAVYDAEMDRLKALLKPAETAKAVSEPPAVVKSALAQAPSAPAATIPGIGGTVNNAYVIPTKTPTTPVVTTPVVTTPTVTAPATTAPTSGLKPMTAAEYQEELNLQLRLFELEGNILAVRKSQLGMMHANLRGIQAEVWAREALNTVTQQFEELNPAGKLTAIKDEAKDFIDDLRTIDASTAKGKKTLAAAKKLAMQVEKQRLAEARKELYGNVATDRWKVNTGLRDLGKDFKSLGVRMPTTVEGFRKLIDATTDGALKDSLLELAPAFVEATNAAEALAQKNKELYSGLLSERALSNLGTSEVTKQFEELGYNLPKSAKELKSWIDKLPTGELKDSLLALIPSFTDAANAAEALAQKNKELYSNLLKPDEVTALKVADLRKDFAELGYVMPTTKEAFRNLLDTLSDGELKDSLLELVPAFTGIEVVASEAAAKLSAAWASIGTASGWAAEHLLDSSGLEYQLATIRSELANTTDVQEREAAISDIISLEQAIWDVQQKRLKKELETTQKQLDADQEKLNSAKELLEAAKSLKEYANELMTGASSGLSKVEQLAAKQSEYEALLVKAQTGDVESINKLQKVSGEYLSLADELSVSQTDYSFLAGKTAAELLTLSTIQEASAKSQIEVLEHGIELAQRQLKLAEEEFALSLETKRLIQQQLEDAKLQFQTETANMSSIVTGLGIANGLLEALPTGLAGVLGPMISAALAARSSGSTGSTSSVPTPADILNPMPRPVTVLPDPVYEVPTVPTPADIINPMPRPVVILPDPIYEAPKTGTSTVVKDIVTSTTPTSSAKTTSSVTMSDIIAASKADKVAGTAPTGIKTTADMIAHYKPILSGSHSTGLTSVPFDGYIAELHKGERVLTAAEAKVYTPPESTSQAELAAEIRALRAQVAALEKSSSKIASNTAKMPQMAEQFDDVADGGFVRTRVIS